MMRQKSKIILGAAIVSCVFLTVTNPARAGIASPDKPNYLLPDIVGECGEESIDTAIGCIPISSSGTLVNQILAWGIGIGGGLALILSAYAGFMITSSTGNPERLKAGQELLTSALAGLILIVFSVFLLEFIGVDILRLPDFR